MPVVVVLVVVVVLLLLLWRFLFRFCSAVSRTLAFSGGCPGDTRLVSYSVKRWLSACVLFWFSFFAGRL